MRISKLESIVHDGGRIALWGWGREGRAAWRAIRSRLPSLPLTVFCSAEEAGEAQAADASLTVETQATASHLSAFKLVVKSPGISAYKPEVIAASEQGTRFIGGTCLWFSEHPQARTICVTGTKGKSTTTALLAHLLRSAGHRTALAGNIGLPLLDLLDGDAAFWVIELSSYQTGDVADSGVRPEVAVVLNIFPEHLDWHGSEQRYIDDKLRLLTGANPHIVVLNANDKILSSAVGAPHGRDALGDNVIAPMPHTGMGHSYTGDVTWFNRADGWHLRNDDIYRSGDRVLAASSLPLLGTHNRGNLCAALAAIEALGLDAAALAPHAATFQPLPHRLQVVGTRDGITYVNDSISTTPHASLAALDVHRGQGVALLVGGYDRGLDWAGFVDAMRAHAPTAIVTMGDGMPGQNGTRIHALLEKVADDVGFVLASASDLTDAMAQARGLLGGDGVILLSPGAPSFGAYRDYTERGRHFAKLAGFDGDAISTIPGLGIA